MNEQATYDATPVARSMIDALERYVSTVATEIETQVGPLPRVQRDPEANTQAQRIVGDAVSELSGEVFGAMFGEMMRQGIDCVALAEDDEALTELFVRLHAALAGMQQTEVVKALRRLLENPLN